MKESKKRYQKKLKSKIVTFYLHEEAIYRFSKTINFNQFVKKALKEAMKGSKYDQARKN